MGFYWLSLFGFVLLMVLGGLFTRIFVFTSKPPFLKSLCVTDHVRAYAYLCGSKQRVHDAKVHAFDRVPGISMKTARALRVYLARHPRATIDDLDVISGVGPKTLRALRDYFY